MIVLFSRYGHRLPSFLMEIDAELVFLGAIHRMERRLQMVRPRLRTCDGLQNP